jgi:hypothetical protein
MACLGSLHLLQPIKPADNSSSVTGQDQTVFACASKPVRTFRRTRAPVSGSFVIGSKNNLPAFRRQQFLDGTLTSAISR